jgi:hypothetical protein
MVSLGGLGAHSMIEIAMDFGADPSDILAASVVGGSRAIDAGAYFVTRESDYLLYVPVSHEDAVRDKMANPTPPAAPVPVEVTETQFIRATVRMGIISSAEGEGYLARGELPVMMAAALNQIPEPARTDARLKAIGSSSFSRSDEVFAALVAAGVTTGEQIDDVFRLAGSLD